MPDNLKTEVDISDKAIGLDGDVDTTTTETSSDPLDNFDDTAGLGNIATRSKDTGKNLDDALDFLAGSGVKKPNEATTTDKKAPVQPNANIDPATGKPRVAPQDTTRTQPVVTDRTGRGNAPPPRAYGKMFRWDAQGNVVSSATGEIVATAGSQRNAFEKMLPIINGAMGEADKYRGMYEAAKEANTIAAKLNLDPTEYAIGARVMAAFKADPKKAVAFLVQQAQDQGVDMSDLGVATPSITPSAIKDVVAEVVKEALQPFSFITQDREEQARNAEALSEATEVVETFKQQHPDVEFHQEAIVNMMNALNLPIDQAYYRVRAHAAQYNFDWNKPLAPQALALKARLEGKQTPTVIADSRSTAQPQRRLPDLNAGKPGNENIVERASGSLPGTASNGDIVRAAMIEAGMIRAE